MLSLFLRLFALRPLLSLAIFGFPILLLVAVGLITIFALKAMVFIVLPLIAIVWLYRRLSSDGTSGA
ncbi:MAG: hypothetical protein KF709_05040 [Gemmatimonadaceae bacterium]|nr:hypothetical protein [Gemmatimonadaceae bacterium]